MDEIKNKPESNADQGLKDEGPSAVKVFACGFGVKVVLGALWMGLKPLGLQLAAACDDSIDALKQGVGEITDVRNQHWWKDRTIYLSVDQDGISLASNEEVSEHKALQKEWDEVMERNQEILDTYYSD